MSSKTIGPQIVGKLSYTLLKKNKVSGVITAYASNNGGGSRFLQTMAYSSFDGRKAVMRILLSIWGGSVLFFQISPSKKMSVAAKDINMPQEKLPDNQ